MADYPRPQRRADCGLSYIHPGLNAGVFRKAQALPQSPPGRAFAPQPVYSSDLT